jgi:RES domain-containing protein
MTIFRLNRSRYPAQDPTGALLHGGRWNSPGTAVLYASATVSLACLEVLVHFRNAELMPQDYVYTEVEVPDELVEPWEFAFTEERMAKIESDVLAREYGDLWVKSGLVHAFRFEAAMKTHPVLTVSSVVIPQEMNYLINPAHAEFAHLRWAAPQPFQFDPRLLPFGAH